MFKDGERHSSGQALRLVVVLAVALVLTSCQSLTGKAPTCTEPGCTEPESPGLNEPGLRLGITVPPLLREAATAGPDPTSLASGSPSSKASTKFQKGATNLAEATRQSLRANPDMGQMVASLDEAIAGVATAKSVLAPQIDSRLGGGIGYGGTFQEVANTDFYRMKSTQGSARGEVALSGRQLLYDFGATAQDIKRATNTQDARALKVVATAEELAQRAADAYVKVLETRQLLQVATENVADLKAIGTLIGQNAQNGNATKADVERVQARILDAESQRSDQQNEYDMALDRYERVTGTRASNFSPPPQFARLVPANRDEAIALMLKTNPRIEANRLSVKAARAEAESLRNVGMPKLTLDGEVSNKQFNGQSVRGELEARSLLTISYRVADGGYNAAQVEQAVARLTQEQMRSLSEQQDLELDVKQAYNSLRSSSQKSGPIDGGLKASAAARDLYREQFKGGKRSLLELLDVQASYVVARRNLIINGFEQQRATFMILRCLGRLTRTILAHS